MLLLLEHILKSLLVQNYNDSADSTDSTDSTDSVICLILSIIKIVKKLMPYLYEQGIIINHVRVTSFFLEIWLIFFYCHSFY